MKTFSTKDKLFILSPNSPTGIFQLPIIKRSEISFNYKNLNNYCFNFNKEGGGASTTLSGFFGEKISIYELTKINEKDLGTKECLFFMRLGESSKTICIFQKEIGKMSFFGPEDEEYKIMLSWLQDSEKLIKEMIVKKNAG